MFNNIFVEFKKGRLLNKEMLIELEHKINQCELQYANYHEGILFGLELMEDNHRIELNTGAVKIQDNIYYLEKKVDIQEIINHSAVKDNERYSIVLVKKEIKVPAESVIVNSLEIEAKELSMVEPTDFYLGEFQNAVGVNRELYGNGDAIEQLKNQLTKAGLIFSVIKQQYAIIGEYTYPPLIFDLLRKILESKKNKNIFDRCFLMNLYTARVLSKKIIIQYLESYQIKCDENDEYDILKGFLNTLNVTKTENIPLAKEIKQEKSIERRELRRTF